MQQNPVVSVCLKNGHYRQHVSAWHDLSQVSKQTLVKHVQEQV